MFKLDENEETLIRNWPVIINVPQDGGTIKAQEINADFLLLPQEQIDEQLTLAREGDGNADIEILRRVVKGIGGVADSDGKAIAYTPELLEKLLKKPYVRSALVNTYFEAAAGKKAKRKN